MALGPAHVAKVARPVEKGVHQCSYAPLSEADFATVAQGFAAAEGAKADTLVFRRG